MLIEVNLVGYLDLNVVLTSKLVLILKWDVYLEISYLSQYIDYLTMYVSKVVYLKLYACFKSTLCLKMYVYFKI